MKDKALLVKELLAKITGYDLKDIKDESKIDGDLGFDSLMILDLQKSLQESFEDLDTQEIVRNLVTKDPSVSDLIHGLMGEVIPFGNLEISDVTQFPEVSEFNEYLKNAAAHLTSIPYFRVNDGIATNYITINGHPKINFSTYNYLGINGSKEINDEVKQVIDQYGTSVSGSRLLSGEIEIHQKLERKIAAFLGAEDALVQVGGHSTNVNTIGNLVGLEDLILHDALAHNSIVQGAILSHAKRKSFKHNDMKHLEHELKKLRHKFRRVLIVVEGVYSMDGDICDLPTLIQLKEKYGAILMIDEAHSVGTIGKNGRGVTSYFEIEAGQVDILMGTLSKALNSCGGYIAGKKAFINYLRYNSPGFIFSVGMTPPNAMAAYKSIQLCERSDELFVKLTHNSAYFLNRIKELGCDTSASQHTPIIPLVVGDSSKTLKMSESLYQRGINVMPIVYPAVKENEARLRFFISASHTKEDIDFTIEQLGEVLAGEIQSNH